MGRRLVNVHYIKAVHKIYFDVGHHGFKPIIPTLKKLKQEDCHEFEASLFY